MATRRQLIDKDGEVIYPDVGIPLDSVVYSEDPGQEVVAEPWINPSTDIILSSMPIPAIGTTILQEIGNITATESKTFTADGFLTGKALTLTNGGTASVEFSTSGLTVTLGGIPYSSLSGNHQVSFCIPVKRNSTLTFRISGSGKFEGVRLIGYTY